MKTILPIIIAVVLSLFIGSFIFKGDNKSTSTETAYERVMRTQTIRCGYALWPPFLDKDPKTNKLSGFNYDIFQAIGRELDLKIEWVEEVGFGNYIEGLKTNRYDVMCQTVWPNPARFKNALVTMPVHYHKVNVVVRTDDTRFNENWKNLNKPEFRAVVVDGDITDTIAKTDFPNMKIVSLPQSADARQMFTEIETGKADATFVDYGFFQNYNKQNPNKLKIIGSVLRVYGSVFSIKEGETELKDLINNAITSLANNGRIEDILTQFPTTAMPPQRTYQDKGLK